MKIQLHPDVIVENTICKKSGVILKFPSNTLAIKILEALAVGCEESHLEKIVGGQEKLILLYSHLEALKKEGFLIYRTTLLDLMPFNGAFHILPLAIHQSCAISRFTWCRIDSGEVVLETPLSPARAYLTAKGSALLHALKDPVTIEELSARLPDISLGEIKETFALLASAKMITAEEDSSLAQWEFHDLLFHTRSRMGRQDAPYGGTFRFKGKLPSQPAVKSCISTHLIDLKHPQKNLDLSLEEAINTRKSIREHGSNPISIEQLGEFLWRCARVKELNHYDGEEITSRPYPGGGARYELEIYPVIHHCQGIEGGIYHYHPLEHKLCKISSLDRQAENFLEDARLSTGKKEYPQILLMITARFQRVSWKYQSMAYALILKNLGVLLQTMYLVATASKLAPCAIGGGDSDKFSHAVGTHYLEETTVGEFMLGSL